MVSGSVISGIELVRSGFNLVRNLCSNRLSSGEKVVTTAINVFEASAQAGIYALSTDWACQQFDNQKVENLEEMLGGYQFLTITVLQAVVSSCSMAKRVLLQKRIQRDYLDLGAAIVGQRK
ncbi:MAG: hypothetical protein HQK53_10070 [Oligoflexia bacterium]|nr:hypothetical protein [Oligoflexia bacterium]